MDTLNWSRRNFLSTMMVGVSGCALSKAASPLWGEHLTVDELNWPTDVRLHLASRHIRLHHFMWHTVRNSWHQVGEESRNRIAEVEIKWVPPRPSVIYPDWDKSKPENRGTRWATTTGAGVDFIYMHRQMIRMLNEWLKSHNMQVESWNKDTIPAPVPVNYPPTRHEVIPPAWEHPVSALTSRLHQLKSDSFYYDQMIWWDQRYKDYSHLKKWTLGELGARMEYDVHNSMHLRWSTQPINPSNNLYDPRGRPHETIDIEDKSWDGPLYDTLLDEYSSHIPRNFWRLHKWIDNRIHDWAEAHGDEVTVTTRNGVSWYEPGKWVEDAAANPWVGGREPGDERDPERMIKIMEQVFNIMDGRDGLDIQMLALREKGGQNPVGINLIGIEELVTGL